MLDLLRGQFAFAIYDSLEGSFFLARDRVGIKPLYFSLLDEVFIFSSELKAIEKSGIIPFSADYDSYISYLRHLSVPSSNTGNKNISKLEPGQYLVINKEKSILKNISYKLKDEIIDHNNFIGGRYSVLSEVGMLPAELMGLNENKFKRFNNLI